MIRLNLNAASQRLSRRGMIHVGSLGPFAPGLSQLLQAESRAGMSGSRQSIINIHLDGGPPHLDTIDPRPEPQ